MKLLNHSTTLFAVPLLLILFAWAGIFYFAMLDEVYDSIGDVLEHQKMVVIQKAATDSTVLNRTEFDDGYYTIQQATPEKALHFKDRFTDTLMYLQVEEDYEPIRMLTTMFEQNGRYYQLQVITSMVEEDDLIDELLNSLIWLYLGLLATVLLLNNFVLKRIWKPFYSLLSLIKEFRLDSASPLQLPKTSVDEFNLLNQSVNRLLQSNVEAYNQQKQFIENAAHELQTPLAISQNKLELLATTGSLTEEQAQLLNSALNNLSRMTRLNKALLLLSRIENRQYPNVREVNIRVLVEELLSDLEELLEQKQLKVTLQQKAPCLKNLNPDLATILLLNLIKNAMVHNISGGFISIFISPEELIIENSGQPIPLNGNAIFGRFHKGNPNQNSTGLGLAIVKAVADLYGFKVSYEFSQKHIFKLTF